MPDVTEVPKDIDTEAALLAAIIADGAALYDVLDTVQPNDFWLTRHQWVYEAMLSLHRRGEGIDYVTVVSELGKVGRLEEIGGAAWVTGLLNQTPSIPLFAGTYGRIIRAAAVRRRLITAASAIAKLAYDGEKDVQMVVDEAQAALAAATDGREESDLGTAAQIVSRVYDDVERRRIEDVSGIPTGFADLDRELGGLQAGDLLLVAGRPGMGKTALQLTIAYNAARRGKRVLVVSLEMSASQNMQRLIAMESKVPTEKQRRGALSDDDFSAFTRGVGAISRLPIWVLDSPGLTPEALRARVKRLHAEHKLDLVMVDYLQLMTATRKDSNRVQEVSDISRAMKQLARELDVPVLAAAQLSRAVEQRQDKRPTLSDLRDSGALEQDADVVLFIYRDDYYNPNTDKKNQADIIIAKHRNGPTGMVSLHFSRELTRFSNLKRMPVDLAMA
jgi:replicative DNA helicase